MAAALDIREVLAKAPSQSIDFVENAESAKFFQTICAFANTDGGDIYVGLDKGGPDMVDVGGIKLPIRNSEEVYVWGVDPASVQDVQKKLYAYFDDPLPSILTEMLDEKGPRGMIVRVHVEPHRGKDPIALADLTIWHRESTENKHVAVRQKPIRPAPPEPKNDTEQSRDDLVPIDKILTRKLSPSIIRAIQIAQEMIAQAGDFEAVNSSYLLFGMLAVGRDAPESKNVMAFLAKQVLSQHEDRYKVVLNSYREDAERRKARYRSANKEYATANLQAIFEHAAEICKQVSSTDGDPVISGRHLLTALLMPPEGKTRGGAIKRMDEIGLIQQNLRAAFLDLMLTKGPPHERNDWRRLFGQELPVSGPQIARYNADRTLGDDQLNITPDVNAMANLIASTALDPPLSVGLFGNWGSGKSFFIQKLEEQINWLAGCARDRAEYQVSYWPNVVQIKFNAWNYADANLWASLVSHVFEELSRSDKPDEAPFVAAKKRAIANFKVATEARADAQAKVKLAEKARDQAKQRKAEREDEIDKTQKSLAQALVQDVWDKVRDRVVTPDVKLQQHLKDMGLAKENLTKSAEQVYRHLQEVTTLAGRLRAIWVTMIRGDGAGGVLLIGGIIAVLVLATSVGLMFWKPNLAWLTAIVGEAAVLLGGVSTWAKKACDKVTRIMEPARNLHSTVEGALKKAEMEKAKEIAVLEEKLKQRQADYEAAVRELDETEQAVQVAEAELQEVETGRLIRRFIEQRVSSEDYRRHLGIVATIRGDFEYLSQLITDFNDSLINANGKTTGSSARVENLGINRIVLYVDDLDRCPPKRVVEVLQAIHLLLAFPLFVVVVAVDSRWVSYALEDQYPHLLVEPAAPLPTGDPNSSSERNGGVSAGPRDYLEKIFQVPFWIRPMDSTGCQKLIDQLVKHDQEPETPQGQFPDEEVDEGVSSTSTGDAVPESAGAGESSPFPDEGTEQSAHASDKPAGSPDSTETAAPPPPRPEALRLESWEVTAMKTLAAIIGRSPREAKRFVNVYRLMKAAVPAEEFKQFIGTKDQPGTFRHAMVLLALATGCPHVSTSLFRRTTSSESQDSNLGAIIATLEKEIPPCLASEWDRLNDFLTDDANRNWSELKMDELRNWMGRVSQFSFEPPTPASSD